MTALFFISLSFAEIANPAGTFNHKKHLLLKLKCSDCHSNPDPGESMSFPATSKCKLCHVGATKLKPEAVPISPSKLPDWVFWSHRTHLAANLKCDSCHDSLTTVPTMGGCVSCHQKSGGPTGCLSCHEGKN